jgi:hypothetical protein
MLFTQPVRLARSFAPASAGSNNAARIAIIAITTSSSINVNAVTALTFSFVEPLNVFMAPIIDFQP